MNSNSFHYSGFYTIVVTEAVKNINETVSSILNSCWSFHMVNVNVLIYNNWRSETIVYTFFPYSSTVCNEMIPIIYDRYNSFNKNEIKKEIFPNKLVNFYRCPVTVTIYQVKPCIVMENRNGEEIMAGIEGDIIRVLGQTLNFTLVILEYNNSKKHLAVRISSSYILAINFQKKKKTIF